MQGNVFRYRLLHPKNSHDFVLLCGERERGRQSARLRVNLESLEYGFQPRPALLLLWHVIKNDQVRFFGNVVAWAIGRCLNQVFWYSRVVPLQLGNPESRLRYCPSGDFPKKLVVVGIYLPEYSDRACGPREVDTLGRCIIEDFIGTTDAIQYLNDFSIIRVHDNEFAGFALVSTLQSAAKKQAMMSRVQPSNVRLGTSGNWPLRNDLTLLSVYDLTNAL